MFAHIVGLETAACILFVEEIAEANVVRAVDTAGRQRPARHLRCRPNVEASERSNDSSSEARVPFVQAVASRAELALLRLEEALQADLGLCKGLLESLGHRREAAVVQVQLAGVSIALAVEEAVLAQLHRRDFLSDAAVSAAMGHHWLLLRNRHRLGLDCVSPWPWPRRVE